MSWLNQNNYKFDLFVLLQGTSPFRNYRHIDNAIRLFQKNINICKTLISVKEINKKNFWILKKNKKYVKFAFDQKNLLRRQDNRKVYLPNGGLYISKYKNLNNFYTNKTIFFEMDEKSSIDLDTLEDFKIAKNYLKN